MKSPPLEWTLDFAHLVARNLLRNQGEPDLDTLSECLRAAKDRIPHGDAVLAGILTAVSVGTWYHICRPGQLSRLRLLAEPA